MLPCNLSLIACFADINVYKAVWQHMQGVVGLLVTSLLQILPVKKIVNRLRFDKIMVISVCPHFFAPPCIYTKKSALRLNCLLCYFNE